MSAIGTLVDAETLALAGITGDMAAALVGLTWREAKEKLSVVLGLAAGNQGLRRGGTTGYTINGRSVNISIEELTKTINAVRTALAYASPANAGPIALGVEL